MTYHYAAREGSRHGHMYYAKKLLKIGSVVSKTRLRTNTDDTLTTILRSHIGAEYLVGAYTNSTYVHCTFNIFY